MQQYKMTQRRWVGPNDYSPQEWKEMIAGDPYLVLQAASDLVGFTLFWAVITFMVTFKFVENQQISAFIIMAITGTIINIFLVYRHWKKHNKERDDILSGKTDISNQMIRFGPDGSDF